MSSLLGGGPRRRKHSDRIMSSSVCCFSFRSQIMGHGGTKLVNERLCFAGKCVKLYTFPQRTKNTQLFCRLLRSSHMISPGLVMSPIGLLWPNHSWCSLLFPEATLPNAGEEDHLAGPEWPENRQVNTSFLHRLVSIGVKKE